MDSPDVLKPVRRLTVAQAQAWIRKAPSYTHFRLSVAVRVVLPTPNPDHFLSDEVRASVTLTRSQAISFVRGCLNGQEQQSGVLIPCQEYVNGDYVAYWIG